MGRRMDTRGGLVTAERYQRQEFNLWESLKERSPSSPAATPASASPRRKPSLSKALTSSSRGAGRPNWTRPSPTSAATGRQCRETCPSRKTWIALSPSQAREGENRRPLRKRRYRQQGPPGGNHRKANSRCAIYQHK